MLFNPHAIVLMMLVAGSGTATAHNLILNGSFEEGIPFHDVTLPAGSTALAPWTITSGSIDLIGTPFLVSDGIRAVDLDGFHATGGIRQVLPTIPGQTYAVSFDLSGNPDAGPQIKQVRVAIDGFSQDYSFDIQGLTITTLTWDTHSFEFVASASSATLSFTSLSPLGNSWGPLVDNVVLVPEPSFLTLGGILGIAFISITINRRRSRQAVDNPETDPASAL